MGGRGEGGARFADQALKIASARLTFLLTWSYVILRPACVLSRVWRGRRSRHSELGGHMAGPRQQEPRQGPSSPARSQCPESPRCHLRPCPGCCLGRRIVLDPRTAWHSGTPSPAGGDVPEQRRSRSPLRPAQGAVYPASGKRGQRGLPRGLRLGGAVGTSSHCGNSGARVSSK